jgi:endonuclease YncB( thermonuclease family)
MKKLLALLLFVPLVAFAADYKILRVIDGDTVEFEASFLPDPLPKKLKLRVLGIDTPEKGHRAQCPKEAELGEKATNMAKKLVLNATKKEIILKEWDKFGGRVLGDLILDGKSLKDSLIAAGLAREYYGDKKKSWCN